MMAAEVDSVRDDDDISSDEESVPIRTLNNFIFYASSGGLYTVGDIRPHHIFSHDDEDEVGGLELAEAESDT